VLEPVFQLAAFLGQLGSIYQPHQIVFTAPSFILRDDRASLSQVIPPSFQPLLDCPRGGLKAPGKQIGDEPFSCHKNSRGNPTAKRERFTHKVPLCDRFNRLPTLKVMATFGDLVRN
jgi:hypothetical protein